MKTHLKELLLKNQPRNGKFYLVAVDGRGGSGKTKLAAYMSNLLPDFTYINGDDYFEPTQGQVSWGVFNDDRFIKDVIVPLKISNTFIYKPYNWHTKPHITEVPIKVNEGLCLERGYSFLFDMDWDLKIWVDTPKEVCFKRGINRDTSDALSVDRVKKAWTEWQSSEDDYIKNTKPLESADIILDGSKPFNEQLT